MNRCKFQVLPRARKFRSLSNSFTKIIHSHLSAHKMKPSIPSYRFLNLLKSCLQILKNPWTLSPSGKAVKKNKTRYTIINTQRDKQNEIEINTNTNITTKLFLSNDSVINSGLSEVYFGPSNTSIMELFVKIATGYKDLNTHLL